MNKDLIVIIQSRSRPQHLSASLEVLFSSCHSKDNFDIYCLIDDDQIELYNSVKEEFPEIKWKIVPHIKGSWFSLVKAQQELIENNSYYFNWILTDDSCIHGISENWDENILTKKDTFKDGLFVLYTQSFFAGRNLRAFEEAYMLSANEKYNADVIINCNEMLPICTKEWVKLMWDIFKDGDYSSSRELITASLIYTLKRKYGINRHVPALVAYGGMSAGEDEISSSATIKNRDGSSRDKAYFDLVDKNFEPLMLVTNQMYNHIENYNK